MFCSPFRRRRRTRRPEESQLSREEAWSLYWAKLEEEANYFSVGDTAEDEDTDICTCHTCIVSSANRSIGSTTGFHNHREVGVFNQEKAPVGTFSVIVQLHRLIDLRH